MPTTLFHGATVLTVDAADHTFADGWLAIRDGRIAGVGSRETQPDASQFDNHVDLAGHLVMPGLINAHTHAAMILFRGRAEGQSLLTMDGWYNAIREPELSLEAGDIGPAVALSCAEMALSGTTTFCDQYFFADEIAAAAGAAGLRAVVAYGIVQLGDAMAGARELENARSFISRQRSADGRVIPWLGPHAPYVDNSEALLKDELAIAREFGVGIHLHMAAGPEDNELTLSAYGLTAAQAMERDGFFENRVHAAHCLDLSAADIAVFARAPMASVAHCASAGLRSGREGICPVVTLREQGVTVALGTDNVAANNSYDMISEMRVAGLVASHRERRAQPLSSKTLVRMATIEGAKALGLDREIGSLEAGKSADFIVVDLNRPGYSETPDPETLLIYSGSGRDVRDVYVAGEQLVRNRELVRHDYRDIRSDYSRAYAAFWSRVEEAKRQKAVA